MKTKLEKAIEYIIGYCEKHPKCKDGCKLRDDYGDCLFWNANSPVDWIRKEREDGADK